MSGERPPHPLLEASGDAMKQRAVRGAVITTLAQAVKLFVQIASVVLLSRMLLPSDFGIYAMLAPIVGFAMLFQDFGLSQALITSKNLTQGQAAMIFRVNAILSIAVAVILAGCAPLISAFYKEPAVTWLIIALSFQIIMAGLTSSHRSLLSRGMRFKQLAILEIVSTLAGFIAALIWAWWSPSPWVLVVQSLMMTGLFMLGAWVATRWLPTESGSYDDIRSMMHFGFGMTGFTLTNFVSRNADNLMIGWAHGATQLGFYDRAYKLLLFPLMQVNAPISNVIIPVLSRLTEEPQRYRLAYLRTVRQMLLLTMPGVTFLIVSADVLIPALMGEVWRPAVPIFMWLGVAAIHQTISNTFGWLFITQRRTTTYAKFGLFATVTCVAAFAAGLPWGAVGVAAAYSLSGIAIRLPLLVWLSGRQGPVSSRDIVKTFIPYLVACLLAAGSCLLLKPVLPGNAYLYLACTGMLIYGIAWTVLLAIPEGRATFKESLQLLPLNVFRKKS
jgi:PST family polysaccharide transporter